MSVTEKWVDVVGYEGWYEVSSQGRVRNHKTGKILSPCIQRYCTVMLCRNGHNKRITVHRLVATAFIPNPNKLPCVNHKDENPTNNHIENLEWCTHSYNSNYGTAIRRRVEHTDWKSETMLNSMRKNAACTRKPVFQMLDGQVIARYESITEASNVTNINHSAISKALAGVSKTSGGFVWKYVNE